MPDEPIKINPFAEKPSVASAEVHPVSAPAAKTPKPKEPKKKKFGGFHFLQRKVKITEKMFFTRYLALMLRSGIPLTKSLEFLQFQMENPRFRKVIGEINRDVTSGITLADSFAKYPDIFDDLFVNMIRSGEAGGNLEEVLDILAEELEKATNLRRKIIGAIIYPAIIITTMIGVVIFIVFFVFPRILKVYKSLNVKIPLLTQILINTLQFVRDNGLYIGGGLAGLILGLAIWFRTKPGRRHFDWLVLRLPLTKTLVRKINTVQFARTFSSLLKSGIATPQALEIVSKTFSNSYYRDSIVVLIAAVRQGRRMGEILVRFPIYPPIVGQMVSVGEETGEVIGILRQLATFFEAEVDQMIENLTKIIEPFLMLILGSTVGFIAIATVQLIYASLQGVTPK